MENKNKEPRQIRYHFYMKWALGLRKAEFGVKVNGNAEPFYSPSYSNFK